jgi:hypothetical protein
MFHFISRLTMGRLCFLLSPLSIQPLFGPFLRRTGMLLVNMQVVSG